MQSLLAIAIHRHRLLHRLILSTGQVEPKFHECKIGPCRYPGFEDLEGANGNYSMLSDRIKHLLILVTAKMPVSGPNGEEFQLSDVSQDGSFFLPLRYDTCPTFTGRRIPSNS